MGSDLAGAEFATGNELVASVVGMNKLAEFIIIASGCPIMFGQHLDHVVDMNISFFIVVKSLCFFPMSKNHCFKAFDVWPFGNLENRFLKGRNLIGKSRSVLHKRPCQIEEYGFIVCIQCSDDTTSNFFKPRLL